MGSLNINIEKQAQKQIPINTTLGDFISRAVSAIMLVAGIATFMYLIWGGIEWITSGGDKDKVQSARERITQSIVGLAIVAGAWAIMLLLDYFFGIGITSQ